MIPAREFLDVVLPALAQGDAAAVAGQVLARWRPVQVCALLNRGDLDTRRVAAMTLGLVGDRTVVHCLAMALHDPDLTVNQMAEHSLWAIWFRSANPVAHEPFQRGLTMLSEEEYHQAIDHFEQAYERDPEFAEAYNQCAIAHFFLDQWQEAIEDCRRTLLQMPIHFGAMASMGHCHAQLGELDLALECYRSALAINPRMTAIRAAVSRIEACPQTCKTRIKKCPPRSESAPES
ncbi:MAG: tetratricopeptide repeat protein [Phycisphaeraceae bacterium]|nr:tetratricopeptide repeat protein [Phycisphaeraceae bacterium]